jgi:hypothetical protein
MQKPAQRQLHGQELDDGLLLTNTATTKSRRKWWVGHAAYKGQMRGTFILPGRFVGGGALKTYSGGVSFDLGRNTNYPACFVIFRSRSRQTPA